MSAPAALHLRAAALDLHAEGDQGPVAPDVITVIPAADGAAVVGRDGRGFVADHQAAIRALATSGMDIPIDWEHATERWDVERAPAAGWIGELFVGDQGHLLGRVQWTPAGRASVESREYRYTSPAIYTDGDSKIVAVVSVGLVNRPNLHVPALNSESMPMPPTQTPALFAACLAALALTESSTPEDVERAMHKARTPDPEKWAPRADLVAQTHRAKLAEEELAKLKAATLDAEIDAALDAATEAGKITPASRDLHRAQITGAADARAGLELFRKINALAPAIVDGKAQGTGATAEDRLAAHANERAAEAAQRAGLSPALVDKIRKGEDLKSARA